MPRRCINRIIKMIYKTKGKFSYESGLSIEQIDKMINEGKLKSENIRGVEMIIFDKQLKQKNDKFRHSKRNNI